MPEIQAPYPGISDEDLTKLQGSNTLALQGGGANIFSMVPGLSAILTGFQLLNSFQGNNQAQLQADQQQREQEDLIKKQQQEQANAQVQIGQNAQTAQLSRAKAMQGPAGAGFGGLLVQPAGAALTPALGKNGKSLFGM